MAYLLRTVVSVVTLLIPVRAVCRGSKLKNILAMTCADYKEHPETLVEDCIQKQQVLSLP
jgi:predicted Co/Zn/Cd cation transporter (cation efflux family)